MPHIMLVDAYKSSVVMTSEIIKDHYSGVRIDVIGSGSQCLEAVAKESPDLVVVDFDLPDTDGVTLAKLLRSKFSGAILLTAVSEEVVETAIMAEHFLYSDISHWFQKPLNPEKFCAALDRFIVKKQDIYKKFQSNLHTELKRLSTKNSKAVHGKIIDISCDGLGVKSADAVAQKVGDRLSLTLSSPESNKTEEKQPIKLRGEVTWMDESKKRLQIKFYKLSAKNIRHLEGVLRSAKEIV